MILFKVVDGTIFYEIRMDEETVITPWTELTINPCEQLNFFLHRMGAKGIDNPGRV